MADLKASGKKGTPVTPETFKAWQDKKRKAKADAAKKLVEAEFKKKKGGKGLSVLSGRALYEYKQDLFVDKEEDGEAVDLKSMQVQDVTEQVQSDLFLEGDDDDLDDLDDD